MNKHLNPGDVVDVVYPFAEGEDASGDLRAKARPALILTVPDGSGNFIAAAITGASHHANSLPITDNDKQNIKFAKASFVRADKIYTFHEQAVIQRRGSLKLSFLGRVLAITCPVVGCK